MTARMIPAFFAALVLAACGADEDGHWQGYVEGDYILLAAQEPGRIETLLVERGDRVAAGQVLFQMESRDAAAAVAEARARLGAEQARLDDLLASVRRPEEREVLRARIAEARAGLDEARKTHRRIVRLAAEGTVSEARLDEATAGLEQARARLTALENELEAAALPARNAQIEAARQSVAAARAALDHAQWRLDRRRIAAPADGYIEETLRYAGEMAAPDAAVISMLPDGRRKIRFFVPEPERASLSLGQTMHIACDGCPADLRAQVSFIASEAEYTPPVIFSVRSRQKLVYMIEARPLDNATALYPGQPVDVTATEAE